MNKVCLQCQIELRPHENGVIAVSMASFGPYELYEADVWHCPQCDWKGILGFASEPFARHHDVDFEKTYNAIKASNVIIQFWLSRREKEKYA